jgi:hypothetical protein
MRKTLMPPLMSTAMLVLLSASAAGASEMCEAAAQRAVSGWAETTSPPAGVDPALYRSMLVQIAREHLGDLPEEHCARILALPESSFRALLKAGAG